MKSAETDNRSESIDSEATSVRPNLRGKYHRQMFLVGIDTVCFLAAYMLNALFLTVADDLDLLSWLEVWPNLLLLYVMVMAGRLLLMAYRNVWRYPNVRAYLTMVVADGCCGAMAVMLSYVLARVDVPGIYIGVWQSVCIVTLFDLSTLVLRFGYQLYHQRRNHAQSVSTAESAANSETVPLGQLNKIGIAIVGAGQVGFHLAEELRNSPSAHYRPICFIDRDPSKIGMRVADLKVYAEDDRIFEHLRKLPVQEVFVAIPSLSPEENQRIIRTYSDAGYKVKNYDFPVRDALNSLEDENKARRVVRDFRVEDLLGRKSLENRINSMELKAYYRNRVVLVTGGGGSIGSEICRQLAKCEVKQLIILDIYENNAYEIQQELVRKYGDKLNLAVEIASVRDVTRLECVFRHYRPDIVFHAAAHKHVPLMEHSACEAIKNNVMGTYNTANLAELYGAEKFVLISTDKAVNPTNIMGASKRMCEMVVQCRRDSKTSFTAVRFGNVLGSNGSVIPLFKKQIEAGGPVTVTDKRIIRYFMTIPEASRLVLTAGSMAKDGELFILDMGKPVRIWDMAENMVRMMGYTPGVDIKIVETGLRPGEKLYEELLIQTEDKTKTENELIFIETDTPYTRAEVEEKLQRLLAVVKETERELESPRIKEVMREVVPTFHDPEEVNSTAEASSEMQIVADSEAYALK